MKKQLTKFALTATLGLAITLTLNACEEKEAKKQDGTDTKPSGTVTCSCGEEECEKEGPKTIEAVFLENDDSDSEGLAYSKFRLANGNEIRLNGFAPDDVKKGDKVSVTYKVMESTTFGEGDVMVCAEFKNIISVKKIGGSATTFTDPRDSKTYKTAKIGNQTWMAENLNYDAKDSKCYDNKPDNCKKYGRMYNWETAKKACPSGWHLPSKAEWEALMTAVGGEKTAGKYLKAKSGWNENGNGEDKFGFSALPGGFLGFDEEGNDSFANVGYFGRWWSSSDSNNGVYFRDIHQNDEGVSWEYMDDKSVLLSVRCIQN